MKKNILSIVLVLALCFNITAIATENILKVGMELAYPPFETKDQNGDPYGLSVDFINDFAKFYGFTAKIDNISWDGLLPSLQTGMVDLVISSMTITDERSQIVDFSKPYANALLAILANINSNIEKYEDLDNNGVRLALKIGSTAYLYAKNNLPNAEIIGLADETACITEVVQGKADAFIYDQLTIYRNHKINPQSTKAIFMPFKGVEGWGVAFKKGNTELLEKMNAFIDDYKNTDGFDRLTEKFLSEEKQAFDKFGFLWFFDFGNK